MGARLHQDREGLNGKRNMVRKTYRYDVTGSPNVRMIIVPSNQTKKECFCNRIIPEKGDRPQNGWHLGKNPSGEVFAREHRDEPNVPN